MNHPFSLTTEELAIADLSFNETAADTVDTVVGGLSIATTRAIGEEGGHEFPFPIDDGPHYFPRPRPLPHPVPQPNPHYPTDRWREGGGPIIDWAKETH
jgi:hypothetical protein